MIPAAHAVGRAQDCGRRVTTSTPFALDSVWCLTPIPPNRLKHAGRCQTPTECDGNRVERELRDAATKIAAVLKQKGR
jgi:hypothetical protein